MELSTVLEIFELIARGTENVPTRKLGFEIRKNSLSSTSQGLVKLAFDTRRIDQEATFNPRRGLQNYHRSEPFVSTNMSEKIISLSKLSNVLDKIKSQYQGNAGWQDSYARILGSAVHKGLRTLQADGDYSDAQPSMASLAYLEELLYVRYRLTTDNITAMGEQELYDAVLVKDATLVKNDNMSLITTSDVSKFSYDAMVDKILASNTNPSIERTITITIKDTFAPKGG